jgi:two-component system OmpR family response regulator
MHTIGTDQRLRVFLIEDNEVIRQNLLEWLADVNARVVGHAETEDDATSWLRSNRTAWDLAVVDMFLLEGSGLGVLRRCRKRGQEQKMVVLTNYASSTVRQQSLALGADAVFDKSLELDGFMHYAMNEVECHQMETRFADSAFD